MGHSTTCAIAQLMALTTNYTPMHAGEHTSLRPAPGSQRKEDYFCWGVGPSGALTSDQTPSVIFL